MHFRNRPTDHSSPMQSLWMLVASLMFSIMGVCVNGGTLHTPLPRQHIWRSIIGGLLATFYNQQQARVMYPTKPIA